MDRTELDEAGDTIRALTSFWIMVAALLGLVTFGAVMGYVEHSNAKTHFATECRM